MLKPGLYDDLFTKKLEHELRQLGTDGPVTFRGPIEKALLPDYLTRFLAARLGQAFRTLGSEGIQEQVRLANSVVELVGTADDALSFLLQEKILLGEYQEHRLEEIRSSPGPKTPRPLTDLSASALITGAPGLPQLGREIERELASADTCEMLVAFIKTGGVRLIREPLKDFTARGGQLRLITTSYLGASDPAAVEELAAFPNTEVRINYDTQAARLHAKAYFFHRESGLSTAYIGSANLSHTAMTSGLEWTVKFAARELPDLFRRCANEFKGYWENPSFEPYALGQPDRFRQAIRKERGDEGSITTPLVVFDLDPHPFQQQILESLQTAREARGQFRNLVVAATGTGKTMVAAFDYRAFARKHGCQPSLLYIAHRKEILQQALISFRQVLRDGNFGGLLVDGQQASSMDHVFCSIQSFVSKRLHETEGLDRWDFVVLDEAHHAEAKSYDAILDAIRPQILLGLTATPERTDGTSVARHFDQPLAAEIRLPDALQDGLLCPFHYFAISDPTADFTRVTWRNGRYDEAELGKLIGSNKIRAQLVIDKLCEYLPDPYGSGDFDRKVVRGLGFCVSIEHAEFMAECFQQAGIPAASLTSKTASDVRETMRGDLANGRIHFIFAVDVFNEGVDIPEVNCVLFLRPTESHVVYLQQLGRGLRKARDKDCLTVLDFVGQCRREFRYDLRFASILP
ncbi:MAG TPA: DEAD/DEAH box helicase family protein, partial [Luteolibacter sp.]